MEIYVQSRGFEPEYDYRWLRITSQEKQRQYPPMYPQVNALIESESPSVVLLRLTDEKLLLLVTAIKAKERTDFQQRQIQISVAWVCEDSNDNERILRSLAARALDEKEQKSLAEEIDHAVTFGGEEGFEVSFQDISRLTSTNPTDELLGNEPPDTTKKIRRTSQKLKNELAMELKKHHLPTEKGPLVVVTDIQQKDVLEKAGVWRGLSSLADIDTWEEIPLSRFSKFLSLFQSGFRRFLLSIAATAYLYRYKNL